MCLFTELVTLPVRAADPRISSGHTWMDPYLHLTWSKKATFLYAVGIFWLAGTKLHTTEERRIRGGCMVATMVMPS